MASSPIDGGNQADESKAIAPSGEARKWPGRLASACFHLVEVAVTGVLGLVAGLVLASWYATSRVAELRANPRASGRAVDFAPDFEPEISMARIWFTSLATGGVVGLVLGILAGVVMARAISAYHARKRKASGGS